MSITVIGAGFAGCEAAYYLAERGINVTLYEMKPNKKSPAHVMDTFAEPVCSNSFKASKHASAAGMLKSEMRYMGSLLLECADKCSLPAGGALAIDRRIFSELVTEKITSHKNITVKNKEFETFDKGIHIVASGPLTSDKFSTALSKTLGNSLFFYDAAAPVIETDSIDFEKAFFASRYNKGTGDYINCGLNKDNYLSFYNELVSAATAKLHDFDENPNVYEGCMPVEILAKRGVDSLRFGALKPVGIRHPKTDENYYAVVQLRKENAQGTYYNMVGFQTNLTFLEQQRVFKMIPGLEEARFVRYGVMHKNTYIDSPRLLDKFLRLKTNPDIFFAGQITGTEGYMESAASGIYSAINAFNQYKNTPLIQLSPFTMTGALISYITDEYIKDFQPMGANMGLLPPLDEKIRDKEKKYQEYYNRGIKLLNTN